MKILSKLKSLFLRKSERKFSSPVEGGPVMIIEYLSEDKPIVRVGLLKGDIRNGELTAYVPSLDKTVKAKYDKNVNNYVIVCG